MSTPPRGRAVPRRSGVSLAATCLVVSSLAACGLAACAAGGGEDPAQRATADACRRDADRVWDAQHRDRLIADDQSLSPISAGGLPDDPSRGLGEQYAHDQRIDDCIARRTSSTDGGATVGPTQPAP